MARRAIFLGSFDPAAAGAMRGWLAAGNEIAAFWYWQSKRKGSLHRDARLAWLAPRWSVHAVTRRHGIPMRAIPRPAHWPDRVSALRAENCDVLISVYFPCIVPTDMLELFGPHAVNLHPAPLPRYRGPTPVHAMALDRSILTDGAMTLHVMSPELDEGAIIAREPIPFPRNAALVSYLLHAARAARKLAEYALPAYLDGRIAAIPQDASEGSYVRVTTDDMRLTSALDARDARFRCLFFARRRALSVPEASGIRVSGFLGEVGSPTGAPPRRRLLSIEMDLRDKRVRFRRRMPWSSVWGKVRDWLQYMTVRDRP